MNNTTSPNDGFALSDKPKTIKPCPKCERGHLVIRTNHDTGGKFLGCNWYPHCTHHEPLPTDLLLRAQGVPMLPGLE